MTADTLLQTHQGGVATLTINRPERRNAIDLPTIQAIDRALRAAIAADDVRVIVITGSGEVAFCAGSDMDEMERHTPLSFDLEMEAWTVALDAIESSPKPVIAAINGFALGGGNELALACHLRVAADHARFGQPEILLGHIPGCGGTQRLPRLLPRGVALELMLFGDALSVADAQRYGLVNQVWPKAEFAEKAQAYAARLAQGSPTALRYILESVRSGEPPLGPGLRVERALCSVVLETRESKDGIAAYFEKRRRKPG